MTKRWFVYLVLCKDYSLYCGIAQDVMARVKAHNEGKGAKYTRGRRPVWLVHKEECGSKSAALKREAAIKKLSSAKKQELADASLFKGFLRQLRGGLIGRKDQ